MKLIQSALESSDSILSSAQRFELVSGTTFPVLVFQRVLYVVISCRKKIHRILLFHEYSFENWEKQADWMQKLRKFKKQVKIKHNLDDTMFLWLLGSSTHDWIIYVMMITADRNRLIMWSDDHACRYNKCFSRILSLTSWSVRQATLELLNRTREFFTNSLQNGKSCESSFK